MNWSTQVGVRILFWLADALIGDSLGATKRAELRDIAISFRANARSPEAAA